MRGPGTRFLCWWQLGLFSTIFSLSACSGDESPSRDVSSSGGGGASSGGQSTGDSGGSTTGGGGAKPLGSGGASTTDASPPDASLSDASADVVDAGASIVPEAQTVGTQGGTLVFENGNITFDFPPGAVDKDVTITVTGATPEPTRWPAIAGTGFDCGPESIRFAKPVSVTIRYATLPAHVDPAMLAIAKGVGAQWKPIHSTSNAAAKTVTANLTGCGTYGVVNLGFVTIERTCGLTGIGEAFCWGYLWLDSSGNYLKPYKVFFPNVIFAPYDAYADHRKFASDSGVACGISTSGELWCVKGTETPTGYGYPVETVAAPAAPGYAFEEISLVAGLICGIAKPTVGDGGAVTHETYCWGSNVSGEFGVGVPTSQNSRSATPVKVSGNHEFVHIAVGGGFVVGITKDGLTYCWGDETWGGCGRGRNTAVTGIPTQLFITYPGQSAVPLKLVSITAGPMHACGIDDSGRAICWGENLDGQIGDGTLPVGTPTVTNPTLYKPPTAVPGYTWARLEAGEGRTCGVTKSSQTYCWGGADVGDGGASLGGTAQPILAQPTPVAVADQSFFTLSLGYYATCGLNTSGVAYCWGDNQFADLGIGHEEYPGSPTMWYSRPQKVDVSHLLP